MDNEITPGENRLRGIDPEKIMLVETDEIAPLLNLQYRALAARTEELLATCKQWERDHLNPISMRHVISDDGDTNGTSDLYRQIADHAGASGEIEETRKKVKRPPFDAIKAIDAWFANLRDRLAASMAAMNTAQNSYASDKAAIERRERDRREHEAREEADRVEREARAAAQAAMDAARKSNATDADVDAAVMAERDAEDHIRRAREQQEEAQRQAAAKRTDLTRSRSALGTTTSQTARWTFEVGDMRALCAAIAAGDAPVDFVIPNDGVINASIRGKAGRRECPGLRIFETYSIRRSGT